ncbi:hypothetical protein JCM3774_006322 [Rhodotorula dairenensis]
MIQPRGRPSPQPLRFVLLLLGVALLQITGASPLEERYDHAFPTSGSKPAGHGETALRDRKAYAVLIALHGVLGFLALQVIAPLGVVIAAIGRSWPNNLWFRMHWKIQAYGSWPVLVSLLVSRARKDKAGADIRLNLELLAVSFAFIATIVGREERDETEPLDLHQQMGFTLLGLMAFQLFLGYYSHARERAVQTFAKSENPPVDLPQKRRGTNYAHIVLGILILTLGGLQITWGFDEYEQRLGEEVPKWIQIVHFAVAGVAPLIITPFILVRGALRMRRGQTFTQAFFSREGPKPYQPPRKTFLNSSAYLEQAMPLGPENDPEKDEVGTSYEKGRGVEGRVRVDSHTTSWPGAATREEYEHEVASTIGHGSVVSGTYEGSLYDYSAANTTPVVSRAQRVPLAEEKSSLLSAAAPMGSSTPPIGDLSPSTLDFGGGPSQIPYRLPTPSPSPTYPPPAPQVFVPPPILPPIEPVSSPPAPARSVSIASKIAAFSPRLGFMPFRGSVPVNMPATADTTLLSISSGTVSSAHSGATSATPLFVYEEPASKTPVVVPSPPPVPPRPITSTPVTSVATDLAVENDATFPREGISPALVRAVSSAARIEGADSADGTQSPASDLELVQQHKLQLEVANPDPPSDPEDDATKVQSPFADDSESSRLMDELERELTISTTRNGRCPRADTQSEAAETPAEPVAHETAVRTPEVTAMEHATSLAREQSGKWLGNAK